MNSELHRVSMKQMLGGGGGGGGEEGRGPSAVLSLFVSCSLCRLFWQANASKLPLILFSADPELLKVKHICALDSHHDIVQPTQQCLSRFL